MFECKFPRQSNAADFVYTVHVENKTAGTAYDLSNAVIYVRLDGQCRGYSELQANSADGSGLVEVANPASGDIAIFLPADRLRDLSEGTYRLGLLMVEGAEKTQILIGEVPIVQGLPKWL